MCQSSDYTTAVVPFNTACLFNFIYEEQLHPLMPGMDAVGTYKGERHRLHPKICPMHFISLHWGLCILPALPYGIAPCSDGSCMENTWRVRCYWSRLRDWGVGSLQGNFILFPLGWGSPPWKAVISTRYGDSRLGLLNHSNLLTRGVHKLSNALKITLLAVYCR